MRYTVWLNVLAGLHLGAGLFLVLMYVCAGDSEVGLLCLSFAFTAAVIAYGLWFRQPWTRSAVVLVYGILVLGPPILILLTLSTAKGDTAGFAPILAFYIACFWAGITLVAALMLRSLYGRRTKQVFGEINALRCGLSAIFVLILLVALILGGIAQSFR